MIWLSLLIGKVIIKATRLSGHSGTALAGKIMETINPNLLKNLTKQLPGGIVVVTGTNGKTTTTKMIVELLESQGAKVFTNKSGSNFTRGILSAMADNATVFGRLKYDMAVLELDEAYFKHFARKVSPNVTLVTNLFRDQLDRYGEISTTADHIKQGLEFSQKAVLYAEDPAVVNLGTALPEGAETVFFGIKANLRKKLPNDNELHGKMQKNKSKKLDKLVVLDSFEVKKSSAKAVFKVERKKHETKMSLRGVYNALNAAAAVATVVTIMPDLQGDKLVRAIGDIQPAFGRGETFKIGKAEVVFGLVKNPAGFNQNIKTLISDKTKNILICVNDNFADGRDVSWLWDVDVSPLQKFTTGTAPGKIYVTGIRAHDMALRLKYADVPIEKVDINTMAMFNDVSSHSGEMVVLPTYTCMTALRKGLEKQGIAKEIHE